MFAFLWRPVCLGTPPWSPRNGRQHALRAVKQVIEIVAVRRRDEHPESPYRHGPYARPFVPADIFRLIVKVTFRYELNRKTFLIWTELVVIDYGKFGDFLSFAGLNGCKCGRLFHSLGSEL